MRTAKIGPNLRLLKLELARTASKGKGGNRTLTVSQYPTCWKKEARPIAVFPVRRLKCRSKLFSVSITMLPSFEFSL